MVFYPFKRPCPANSGHKDSPPFHMPTVPTTVLFSPLVLFVTFKATENTYVYGRVIDTYLRMNEMRGR